MFCPRGHQGTFPSRANSPQTLRISEHFYNKSRHGFLQQQRQRKVFLGTTKIQFNLPRFCARVRIFFFHDRWAYSHSKSTKTYLMVSEGWILRTWNCSYSFFLISWVFTTLLRKSMSPKRNGQRISTLLEEAKKTIFTRTSALRY